MYLALYRKYRPQTFDDVISQPHITTTLLNQIKSSQTAHAYLFTGSRGTGKTSCAKILAKAVNCENPTDGNPCLSCSSCAAIDEGVPDVIEIDAASNNSVEDVRTLRDELNYLPVSCKYRVYIIDEAHMLSASAFNALLKTLEEPPIHVIFILATTENHKIPATILSRCQRFDFRRIDLNESANRLIEVAEKEGAVLEPSAARLISRLSEGGMRDALSLLDTCLSIDTQISADMVRECAGIAGKEHLFQISGAIQERNPSAAVDVLNRLHNRSKDLTRLIDELIYHYRNLMLIKATTNYEYTLSCLPDEINDYRSLSDRISLHEVMRCLRILEDCFERIGRSKNAKITAEMTVIELCTPNLDLDLHSIAERITAIENEISSHKPDNPLSNASLSKTTNSVVENIDKQDTACTGSAVCDIPPPEEPSVVPNYSQTPEESVIPPNYSQMPEKQTSPAMPPEPPPTPPQASSRGFDWASVVDDLPGYLGGMLDDTTAVIENGTLIISGGIMAGSVLENPENKSAVLQTAQKLYGQELSLQFNGISGTKINEPSKAEAFLSLAKARGVEIKRK